MERSSALNSIASFLVSTSPPAESSALESLALASSPAAIAKQNASQHLRGFSIGPASPSRPMAVCAPERRVSIVNDQTWMRQSAAQSTSSGLPASQAARSDGSRHERVLIGLIRVQFRWIARVWPRLGQAVLEQIRRLDPRGARINLTRAMRRCAKIPLPTFPSVAGRQGRRATRFVRDSSSAVTDSGFALER
jgi:hypothetical protein